jgi:hypothetical protein
LGEVRVGDREEKVTLEGEVEDERWAREEGILNNGTAVPCQNKFDPSRCLIDLGLRWIYASLIF